MKRLRLIAAACGARVHLTTDPACRKYHAPREGSLIDAASRGWSCPKCMGGRDG